MEATREQRKVCAEHNVVPDPPDLNDKLGISKDFSRTQFPINGLRHPPNPGTCGWYIWSGEHLSDEPDFFNPLHVSHMKEWCPEVSPYLALPAGWRFLYAPGHIDVWYDPSLLELDDNAC
jgi:hypothetical protein